MILILIDSTQHFYKDRLTSQVNSLLKKQATKGGSAAELIKKPSSI
jgi:hypothetical protein